MFQARVGKVSLKVQNLVYKTPNLGEFWVVVENGPLQYQDASKTRLTRMHDIL